MFLCFVILFLQFYQIYSQQICVDEVCYYFKNLSSSEFLSYDGALKSCNRNNLTLAIINNRTTQNIIINATQSKNIIYDFYIGLKYIAKERFIWENGIFTIPNFTWVPLINTDKDACIFMTVQGQMNMSDCSIKKNFICSNSTRKHVPDSISNGSCPAGFFKFANSCYKMNFKCGDQTYTWNEANEKCISYNSRLVVIDSFQEQEFITALMSISPQPAWTGIVHKKLTDSLFLWIDNSTQTMVKYPIKFKDGEPNGFATRDEHCLMIYSRLSNVGYFNDELCSKSMNFICKANLTQEKPEPKSISNPLFKRGNCSEKYFQFNETCYSMELLSKSYSDSVSFCKNKVLKVYNPIHIAFMRSLMSFVGAENVWLSVVEPDGRTNGAIWLLKEKGSKQDTIIPISCYYMTQGKGLVISKECSKPEIATSCYYYLPGHEELIEDYICPINWKRVGLKCFKIIQDFQTFSQSVSTCANLNSKLASLQNMKEVQAVNMEIVHDAWFGISGETYLTNTWLDGSPIEYCLFRHTIDLVKLIKKDPKKMCFVIRAKKAEWNDEKCDTEQNSICEMPATKNKCPTDFPIYVDGDCFGQFKDARSWADAERDCQNKGGINSHLASFNSMSQENEVFSKISDIDEHWIGLRVYNSTKMWIDGSNFNFIRNAIILQSSVPFNCFCSQRSNLNSLNIRWSIVNCEIRRPFICRISRSRKSELPTTTIAPIIKKMFCPKEYIRYRNSCFMIVNKNLTWSNADHYCRGNRSRLASFDSREEFNFVLSHMRNMSFYVWIGLYNDEKTNQTVWLDEKPLNFHNFLEMDYPDSDNILSGKTTAMYVSANPFINGHWRFIANLMNLPFICRSDQYLTSNPNVHVEVERCPQSYTEYNGQCYKYNDRLLSFKEAYHECKLNKSDLLVLSDTFEEHFINSFSTNINSKNKLIWMGFKVDAANNMMTNWSNPNGVPIYYTHWKSLSDYEKTNFYSDDNPHFDIHGCYLLNLYFDEVDRKVPGNGMIRGSCDIPVASVCKMPVDPMGDSVTKTFTCAWSRLNISYDLDVTKTKNGERCIRWDIVKTVKASQFHINTFLYSSVPFNKDGYISYSLNRCSELRNKTDRVEYSCYVFKGGKYFLEQCSMQACGTMKAADNKSNRTVLVILIGVTMVLLLICIIFFFRQKILSNYRIRSFLAHSLGRYQPDCLGDPHRPHTVASGGVGFSNPVYTALESRY